jgi:hypothetical protein
LITGGGFVRDDHFNFNARADTNWTNGELNYTFRVGKCPPTKVHSVEVTAVFVDRNRATSTRTASANGTSGFTFRFDVVDGKANAFAIVAFASDDSVPPNIGSSEQPLALGGGSIHIPKPSA